jgi:hypothetical protein
VGPEKAYGRYRKIQVDQQISENEEMAWMNWDAWGGWGPWY